MGVDMICTCGSIAQCIVNGDPMCNECAMELCDIPICNPGIEVDKYVDMGVAP